MQIKPNRLVFQEKPGETNKPLSTNEELKGLKEQVQRNNSLAYQRLLVLESFSKTIRDNSWLWQTQPVNFRGDDFSGTEVYTNPDFQYTYEQLDKFFRINTSERYPINFQKEWMNKAVEWTVSYLQGHCGDVFPLTKDDIDACILGLKRSSTPSNDYNNFKYALYSPGPFKEWVKANYPDEYRSISW